MLDGELAVAENAVGAFAARTEVIVIPHANASGVLACTTVVAQRAHKLATLAAGATRAIGDNHLLRQGVEHDATRCDAFFNNPPFGKSAAGDKSGKTDAYAADNHLTTSEALLRGLLSAFRRFRGLSLPQGPLLLLHRMFLS